MRSSSAATCQFLKLTINLAAKLQLPDWPVTWHGLLTVITIALAVTSVSEHQGGPQLLCALFFGMVFNIAANGEKVKAGIECASRDVLRFGVALHGRILGRPQTEGLLIGGAVAMFGASAVTPNIVVGVTTLSTVAMIVYLLPVVLVFSILLSTLGEGGVRAPR